jgi:hypothetical protein
MIHDRVQMLQVQTELCFSLGTHDYFLHFYSGFELTQGFRHQDN